MTLQAAKTLMSGGIDADSIVNDRAAIVHSYSLPAFLQ